MSQLPSTKEEVTLQSIAKFVEHFELLSASEAGNLEAIKDTLRLSEHNINVNDIRDEHGRTPLHLACRCDHLQIVQYLLEEQNADVQCRTNQGNTPLHHACWKGCLAIVHCLTNKSGIDINSKNNGGNTPLHWACSWGHLEIVRHLTTRPRININSKNKQGATPLQSAERNNKADVVNFLKTILEQTSKDQTQDDHHESDVPTTTPDDPMSDETGDQNGAPSADSQTGNNFSLMELWYNKALKGGAEKPRRLRLMMSGPFGAGKSSVVRSLQGEPFKPTYESTEGISIEKKQLGPELTFQQSLDDWLGSQDLDELVQKDESHDEDLLDDTKERDLDSFLPSRLKKDQRDQSAENQNSMAPAIERPSGSEDGAKIEQIEIDDNISMSVWDFAGQIEYHSMHQMFFRSKCLYLLVLDLQTDDMNRRSSVKEMLLDARKWLNAIVSSAGTEIGLIVVGTHADCFKTWKEAEDRLQELFSILGKSVTDAEWDGVLIHAPTLVVDNKKGRGIPELRRALQHLAVKLLDKMDSVPMRWLRLLEKLETTSLEREHFCVALDIIKDSTKRIGFTDDDEEELVSALSYFDQSGNIVYITSPTLERWVFPQPQLLLDAMAPLLASPPTQKRRLTRDEERLEKEGYLTNEGLEKLWTKSFVHDHDQVREVLSASGLIIDLSHGVVVPSRLPDEEVRPPERDGEHEIMVETYFTTHLPPSLFSYALATIHREQGMGDIQDLAMISRYCSCLALAVPRSLAGQDMTLFEFRVMLSLNKLSHSIFINVFAAPKSGVPGSSIKDCLVEVCLSLLGTLHSSVNQRYQDLKLSSWSRTTGSGAGVSEWCILETKGNSDGEQSFKKEYCCKFGSKHTLCDTVLPVGGNKKNLQENPVDPLVTRMLLENGLEKDVGQLSHSQVPYPDTVWPCERTKGYVFLSHRGPDTKEIIARPTYWFLTKILKVNTFLDDETMNPSDEQMLSLMEPAYRCNHALILLSPLFRKSKYCVKELNTFMARYKNNKNITVIPALWDLENVEGYAPALRHINWLKPGTSDPATYMIEKLWPFLVKTFGHGQSYNRDELAKFLDGYVEQIPANGKRQRVSMSLFNRPKNRPRHDAAVFHC